MLHENNEEKSFSIVDTDVNFEKIYGKEYIPHDYIDDIKSANVLLIPNEGFRDKKGYYFPECTPEFYLFLKKQEEITTEICIDDEEFQRIELHSDVINVATLLIEELVFPIVATLISTYLYDKVKSMNKKKDEVDAKVHIIIEKKGKSKRIEYKGSVEDFEETMKTIEKTIFK